VGIDFGTGEIALVPKVVGMRKTAGYRVIRVQVQNAKKKGHRNQSVTLL
jgi:hypothetical protein